MALASACDWRVASASALLYVPELRLGMNMSWQSVPRFVSLIGPARSKQLLILAEPLPAATAEQWGLVDHLSADGEALELARIIANKVAAMPPLPVRMVKDAIDTAARPMARASSFMDTDQFMLTQASEDAIEGPLAFFEKRSAKFTGR